MSAGFPLPEAQLKQLQLFVELLKNPAIGPQVLHAPQMQFFRDYLLSLGATLPPKAPTPSAASSESKEDADREEADAAAVVDDDDANDDADEVDVNAFPRDVVDESQQPFGDSSVEVTDDMLTESDQLKSQAREAASEGDYARAVSLYSQAIVCNPGSASLIAKRAEAFLKLSKPMAAIHDCNKAIQLNKNAAGAYYVRGKARALIGEWEAALHDMQVADQLDADCGAYDLLKDYREKGEAAKAKRVEKERKRAEKEKKKHSYSKPVHVEEEEEDEEGFNFGGAGAGAGGTGGMPDLMGMLGNPKIQKMMQEVMSNPAKLNEYMNDPEVGPLLKQAMASFGGGMGGANNNPFASFGGGAAPSSASAASSASSSSGAKPSFNDVDVD
eukprot:TRINITY_DN431_c0_g1_i1.p1 TRINITY_DN431_c0_g1~~TRINITY_DN431_c0_g1_i1.p1  ORF type:complete len:417 (+),score=149.66 TRINITY_DN431_c0_g1_i1:96-1253(+)